MKFLVLFLKIVSGSLINTIVVKGYGDKTVVNWKLDLSKKGFQKICEPYKEAIFNVLVEADKPLGSGAVWNTVRLEKGVDISRASVIFFLNFLVADGLCTFDDATGKGGHHKLYRLGPDDWKGIKYHLTVRIIEALGEALEMDMTPALGPLKW